MEKIFETANDQHLRSIVFYGKTADHKLYYDADCTTGNEVMPDDLEHAFILGVLVIKEGTTLRAPISYALGKVKTVDAASNTVSVTEWTSKIN